MKLLRRFPYSVGLFFVVCPLIAFRRDLWPRSFEDLLLHLGLLVALIGGESMCNVVTHEWDRRQRRGPRDGRHAAITLLTLGTLVVAFYRSIYSWG